MVLHEHNAGFYCGGYVARRVALTTLAGFLALYYLAEICSLFVFAYLDHHAIPPSECYGVRCPSQFSCVHMNEFSYHARKGFTLFVGFPCALAGFLGGLGRCEWETRVFELYLWLCLALYATTLVGDVVFEQTCGAYPATVLSSMPVYGAPTGRAQVDVDQLYEVRVIDRFFGYHVLDWYIGLSLAGLLVLFWTAREVGDIGRAFTHGMFGLGPSFSIGDGFGGMGDQFEEFRVGRRLYRDLLKEAGLKQYEVYAGYGTIPAV